MEGLPSPHGSLKHSNSRKALSSSFQKDLWTVAREGSVSELESSLTTLKKNGGNVDAKNAFGLTPLHIATWRNNVPIVKRLIAAGADPNIRDGESGWSSLHRALHFGHLAVASVLLSSGASLTVEDSDYRIPADLISGPVSLAVGTEPDSVSTEVFSWGSGTNYQLGTGNAHIQKLPCKVDALQGSYTRMIAAAKFHSVAIGAGGELYTWGYGRGGRLGHPDFEIHSGQAAVITPRQVMAGLGNKRVKTVAVAKHHTIIATENGEVFTWGSNREGQLGYTSVDTQPTPRRVSYLRCKVIAVAAANKHSAAVADTGEVLTWGCNKEGQLGYGTSNSASNYTPRVVDYLKGKSFAKISAAKYHTIALSDEGEVFAWGHRLVTPRRVVITRNLKKGGNVPMKFHCMERLHVVAVAAGMTHSTALTDDGTLFYWASADPDLRCQQLSSMCGKNIVSISAGKYWTASVTDSGDVYMWDGKKQIGEAPIPIRLHGVKHATSVSVGETHLLVLCALYHPIYPPKSEQNQKSCILENDKKFEELDGDFMFDESEPSMSVAAVKADQNRRSAPSLKSLCEKTAIEFLLEPRNAIQLLEVADSLGTDELRMHCEDIAIRNLDFIFTVSSPVISNASLEILSMLEKSLDAKSSESWCHRRLPTPTATFPAVIDVQDESLDKDLCLRIRDNNASPLQGSIDARMDSFLSSDDSAGMVISKQVRALRKKLQQIELLENKLSNGHILDDQQVAKLQTKFALENALADLGFPVSSQGKPPSSVVTDGKGKKTTLSQKQRRKGKQKDDKVDSKSEQDETCSELQGLIKCIPEIESIHISSEKEVEQINQETGVGSSDCSDHVILKGTPKEPSKNENNLKPAQVRRKNKKGGLSMFLSGALDDTPKITAPTPPPLPPKIEGPAWGGIQLPKGATSLRVILDEQSRTKLSPPMNVKKEQPDSLVDSESSKHLRLSSFMTGLVSSPIAVIPAFPPQTVEAEKNTPPWSSTGTPPSSCRPSLRDIQLQEEKKHTLSRSPKTRTTGFMVSPGQSSSEAASKPKDAAPSCWYKPEMEAPSPIRSIQIEEKAMKDLKRVYKYSSVRLVKAQRP